MKFEHNEISLRDLVSFIVDNRGKTVPIQETGIPLIATSNISNEDLYPSIDTDRYVSKEIYSNWFRSHPEAEDIILTNKGSKNGEVCLVPNTVNFCIAQDMVALRANKKIINSKYLFASLRSPLVQKRIKSLNVDAVIPHFKKTDFDKLLIPVPSFEVQEFIGQIYYEISRKIELNKRTTEVLGEISKALFKSWFIDFDPVRAKTEGLPTGFADTFSDLFPGSFIDSELGEIPKNWEVKSLDEIATFLNGIALQKYPSENNTSNLPVIKIAQLRKGNTNESDKCSKDIEEKYIIRDGDILFSWSGSLLVDIWTGGLGALNQHLFKVTSDIYKKWFILSWTKYHLEEFQRIAKSKATTMGHIQRKHLSEAKTIIPPKDLMEKINNIFEPLLERQLNARLESKFLSQMRNAILPKLISGELKILDAKKIIEEAEI